MELKQFDFAIIGAGAAGLQLALALSNDVFFSEKTILIIDKDDKTKNDKTWCFWEEGNGQWDHIVSNTWQKCLFADKDGAIELSLKPHFYKKIKSIDFYNYAIEQLNKKDTVTFLIEDVTNVIEDANGITIISNKNKYYAKQCFDSRVSSDFFSKHNYPTLKQHFEGWLIEFDEAVLNDNTFTIMDYRANHNNTTSFIYVLPHSKKQALVEFTGFTKQIFKNEIYAQTIDEYIKKYINKKPYKLIDKEAGIIPMSTFPFEKANTNKLTKIGTAGGWVRASSGYSFKNCEQYIAKIIENLKEGRMPSKNFVNKKHRLFDGVLLEVLSNDNSFGLTVFSDLYRKNKLPLLLKFLDGTTNFAEDLKIMNSVDKMRFTKAMLRVKSLKQN